MMNAEERKQVENEIKDLTKALKSNRVKNVPPKYKSLDLKDSQYHRLVYGGFGLHHARLLVQFLRIHDPTFEKAFIKFLNDDRAGRIVREQTKQMTRRLEVLTKILLEDNVRSQKAKKQHIKDAYKNGIITAQEQKNMLIEIEGK